MDNKVKVTARQINEAAQSLESTGGYSNLAKHYRHQALISATTGKGVALIEKDSALHNLIKDNAKQLAMV